MTLNGTCEKIVASPDGRLIAAVEDELVLRDAVMVTPARPLARATALVAFLPIRLPCTWVPVAVPEMLMPSCT